MRSPLDGKRTGGCLGREGVIGALGAKIGIDKIGIDLLAKSASRPKSSRRGERPAGEAQGNRMNPHDQSASEKRSQGPGDVNPLASLHQYGQAPWLDFLARASSPRAGSRSWWKRDGSPG